MTFSFDAQKKRRDEKHDLERILSLIIIIAIKQSFVFPLQFGGINLPAYTNTESEYFPMAYLYIW